MDFDRTEAVVEEVEEGTEVFEEVEEGTEVVEEGTVLDTEAVHCDPFVVGKTGQTLIGLALEKFDCSLLCLISIFSNPPCLFLKKNPFLISIMLAFPLYCLTHVSILL